MPETSFKELLDAGVHFGHLKRKWNPAMAPYIFMEKNGIHIIDLNKTEAKLREAAAAMKQIAKSGRKILFVATKKQAKDIVAEKVKQTNMPYVTERWPGGMLTNFPTIRKAVKKMAAIDKMATDGTFDTLSKRERLQITRQRAKLEKNLGSIADLTRLPAAMFVVDVTKEYIAVREANRLNIPVFAMVDTNSDPRNIDFPIPANDDASKSISLIINYVADAVYDGLKERKMEKEKEAAEAKAKNQKAREAQEAKAAAEKEKGEGGKKERKRISKKIEVPGQEGEKPKEKPAEKPAAGAPAAAAPAAAAEAGPVKEEAGAKPAEKPAARAEEKPAEKPEAPAEAEAKPVKEEAAKEESVSGTPAAEAKPVKEEATKERSAAGPETTRKPESEAEEKPADKPEAPADAKPAEKAEAPADVKPTEKEEAPADAKPSEKAEAPAEAKPAEQPEAKGDEAKTEEPKAEEKTGTGPAEEPKAEKSETKEGEPSEVEEAQKTEK